MMHHHVTIVLAGATAHYLTGWFLNSDLVLGKIWKQEKAEKGKKGCGPVSKDMRVNIVAQMVVSTVIALATCTALAVFQKAHLAMTAKTGLEQLTLWFFNQEHAAKSLMHAFRTVFFIWIGFLVPFSAQDVIWCGHNVKHWALASIAELVGLMALAATVTYLA